MAHRPRVGISRCLLGDDVRYDGTHTLDADLIAALTPHVEWVPVCPEVEVGMGTPREPIHLVAREGGVPSGQARVGLFGVTSGTDWTARMHAWARVRVDALRQLQLSGFVLKARSPSCGIRGVRIECGPPDQGRGLFAQAIVEVMPDLPIADEDELRDSRCPRGIPYPRSKLPPIRRFTFAPFSWTMLSSSSRGAAGMSFAPQPCDMQPDWPARRVALLEQRVERLENLPSEVNSLRTEFASFREYVYARFDAVDVRFDAVEQTLISLETQITGNHREFRERFDELGRYMRVLHEDVIDRISKIRG